MEKTRLIQKAALLLPAVREKRPLIHCITNYVAANDSANLLLAVGASPIMADCASEASEIAGKSAGVLLNLGIPNPDKLRAMRLAARRRTCCIGRLCSIRSARALLHIGGKRSADF